ncbi:MAG: hypothetical protein H7Y31_17125, partial [Chitinophagaceae bacterium]|nr:hypothetical protein [Chitinophagaceae bacterium]
MKKLKTILITVSLALVVFSSPAQDKLMDSINDAISRSNSDTQRINRINNKLQVTAMRNLDTTINIATDALKTAIKINYYKGEFDLRIRLIMTYSFKGLYPEARQQMDTVQQIIQSDRDSIDYTDLYGARGLYYGIQSKFDSSIIWLNHAIRISERLKLKKLL